MIYTPKHQECYLEQHEHRNSETNAHTHHKRSSSRRSIQAFYSNSLSLTSSDISLNEWCTYYYTVLLFELKKTRILNFGYKIKQP